MRLYEYCIAVVSVIIMFLRTTHTSQDYIPWNYMLFLDYSPSDYCICTSRDYTTRNYTLIQGFYSLRLHAIFYYKYKWSHQMINIPEISFA